MNELLIEIRKLVDGARMQSENITTTLKNSTPEQLRVHTEDLENSFDMITGIKRGCQSMVNSMEEIERAISN